MVELFFLLSKKRCLKTLGICLHATFGKQVAFIFSQFTGWSDSTVICGHITISMLRSNTAHCVKLSG